ncbi:MAG: hypothetical protein ACXVB0_10860 [Mucilaginibacter sp.]
MNADPEKFEINSSGTIYKIERSMNDKNVYRIKSLLGTYLIAKDFYGIWVELTSKSGSPPISLNQIGREIENHYNSVGSL